MADILEQLGAFPPKPESPYSYDFDGSNMTPEQQEIERLRQLQMKALSAPSPTDYTGRPEFTPEQLGAESEARAKQDLIANEKRIDEQRLARQASDLAAAKLRMQGMPKDMQDAEMAKLKPKNTDEIKRLQDKLAQVKPESAPVGMAESLKARSGDDIVDAGTPTEELPLAQMEPAVEEDLSLSNLPRMKTTADSAPVDYMKALLAAQDQSKDLAAYQMMGKGAERIGSAISRTAHDKDYLNEMNPMIQQPVMDVMNKQKLGLAGLDEQSKRRDIAFKQDMDDPNGNASQMYRSTAKKLIASSPTLQGINLPDNISASEMEKLTPTLFNITSHELARQAKSADMKVKLGEQTEKLKKEQVEQNSKKAERFRNSLNTHTKTQQSIYDTRMQMVDELNDYMTNPRESKGFRDIAVTYGFIKGRDDSAVREGEIKLLGEAGSLPDRTRRAMNRALRGETYNQADMAALIDVLKTENKGLKKSYKSRSAATVKQAEKDGLDIRDIVRPDMYGLDDDLQEEDSKPTVKVVMPDGKIWDIPKANQQKALDRGGKLVK